MVKLGGGWRNEKLSKALDTIEVTCLVITAVIYSCMVFFVGTSISKGGILNCMIFAAAMLIGVLYISMMFENRYILSIGGIVFCVFIFIVTNSVSRGIDFFSISVAILLTMCLSQLVIRTFGAIREHREAKEK